MLIRPLAASPHVPVVAGWLHAQWWGAEGSSLAATAAWLAAATGPAEPLTLVAECAGAPLGAATLDTEDLDSRPDVPSATLSFGSTPPTRRNSTPRAAGR